MFKRIYRWVLSIALILFATAVAISNRDAVPVYLDPFRSPESQFSIPLYIVILISLWIGMMIGGIISWRGGGKTRKIARAYKRIEKKSANSTGQDISG